MLQECNVEEASDEEEVPSKGSKDKKANGPDSGKGLVFKITSKVAYKTVLKGLFSVNLFQLFGNWQWIVLLTCFVLQVTHFSLFSTQRCCLEG